MNDNIRFSQAHSDSIRSRLVEMVETETATMPKRRPSRRRWFIVSAIVLGSVASVAAAAVAADTVGWIALPGTRSSASPSYAAVPHWPVNANGQTYGRQGSSPVAPDLIEVQGTTSEGTEVIGYVYSGDLAEAENGGPPPTSPAQALKQQNERLAKYPNGRSLPVYKSDGTTVIGLFTVGP